MESKIRDKYIDTPPPKKKQGHVLLVGAYIYIYKHIYIHVEIFWELRFKAIELNMKNYERIILELCFPPEKDGSTYQPQNGKSVLQPNFAFVFFGTDEPTRLLILKQPGYSLWDVAGFIQEHSLQQNWEIFFDLLWLAVHFVQNYTPE